MDLRKKFNEDAAKYDKMRPLYVKELYSDILGYANLSEAKVLEIGIGTGQATLPFLKQGFQITAVDLNSAMIEFSQKKFFMYKNIDYINQAFEDIVSKNDDYDIIYSASAFHWIDEQVGYPKVYSLLKRTGTLALFWNHPVLREESLNEKMQVVYDKYFSANRKKTPIHKYSCEKCEEIIEKLKSYKFCQIKCNVYYATRILNGKEYIELLETYSDHRALNKLALKDFSSDLLDLISSNGNEIVIDDTIDLYLAKKI